MKKLIWIAGVVAMASAGSVYAAPSAHQEEVDFRAVNPVLQSLVDFAYPRFDESFCDLKAEKLKYDLQGSLKTTPWLDGHRADVTGSSSYWSDRTVSHTGIVVTLSASARTDVLALIRYSAYVTLRKVRDKDIKPEFLPRFKAHLKRLAVVTSLEQVQALLMSGQRLAKDMFNGQIAREIDELHCLEDGQCLGIGQDMNVEIARQKSFIASLQSALPAYDQIKFETKSDSGKVHELTISSPDVGLFILDRDKERTKFFLIPGKHSVTLMDQSISASAEAFHKMPVEELDRLKGKFEKKLVGVQNGNGLAKDDAQDAFKQALKAFRRTIRGEW
jgi:hypothetical protein